MEKNRTSRTGKILAALVAVAAVTGWSYVAWKQTKTPGRSTQISKVGIQPETREGYSDTDNQVTRLKQTYAPLFGINYSAGPRGVDLGNTNGFGYDPRDPWEKRKKTLERWAIENENPQQYRAALDLIAGDETKKGDEAPQVSLLAMKMDDSLHAKGDFSDSPPYQAQQALETRVREIGTVNPVNELDSYYLYRPELPLADRLSVVERIVRDNRNNGTSELNGFLEKVRLYEEGPVKELGKRAIEDFNSNGSYETVSFEWLK